MKKGREVGKEGEEKKGRREQILITGQIQEETNKGVPYNYNHTDLCDYMIIVFFQKKGKQKSQLGTRSICSLKNKLHLNKSSAERNKIYKRLVES